MGNGVLCQENDRRLRKLELSEKKVKQEDISRIPYRTVMTGLPDYKYNNIFISSKLKICI